ncbi:MAG: TraX family protein [Eubacteriales bacterium]|nr:TraX family protein [Eubacteriales bacterium]
MKKYNAFQIKLLMALLMVLDHLPHIPGLVPPVWAGIFHVLTRCVAVWFAYMAVEGFVHTHSRLRYNLRLFLWSGIMLLGNLLLNRLLGSRGIAVYNNIFLTLALGVLLLNLLWGSRTPGRPWAAAARILGALAVSLFGLVFAEGALVLLPFMVITYGLREKPRLRNTLYFLWGGLLLAASYVPYETVEETVSMFLYNSDGMFFTVLPFLYLYNGQRGPNTRFSKYFFYVFYPAHLWLIAVIAYFAA